MRLCFTHSFWTVCRALAVYLQLIHAVVGDIGLTCWVKRARAHCYQCVRVGGKTRPPCFPSALLYVYICIYFTWESFILKQLGATCVLWLVAGNSFSTCPSIAFKPTDHLYYCWIKVEPIWTSVLLPLCKHISFDWCRKYLRIVLSHFFKAVLNFTCIWSSFINGSNWYVINIDKNQIFPFSAASSHVRLRQVCHFSCCGKSAQPTKLCP